MLSVQEAGRLGIPAQQFKKFSFHLTLFLKLQVKSNFSRTKYGILVYNYNLTDKFERGNVGII